MKDKIKLDLQLFGEDPTPQPTEPQPEPQPDIDYVGEIDKLIKENQDLKANLEGSKKREKDWMDKALNRGPAPLKPEPVADINQLRNAVINKSTDITDLEYAKAALEFRDACIKQEGYDPFVATNSPEYQQGVDEARAKRVADCLQFCVDESKGNPDVFKGLLNSRIKEDQIQISNKRKFF